MRNRSAFLSWTAVGVPEGCFRRIGSQTDLFTFEPNYA